MAKRFLLTFRHPILVMSLGSLLLLSCAPLGQESGGKCKDSSGNTVDVKTPFGKWKKVSGYETEKSAESLKLNYDVLIVEMGAILCSTRVVNGTQATSVYKAAYEHNVDTKQLDITYLAGDYDGSERVSYSFSGSCEEPKMTITHTESNESPETYVLVSKTVAANDCQVSSE